MSALEVATTMRYTNRRLRYVYVTLRCVAGDAVSVGDSGDAVLMRHT